jgi:D-glycero-D-manno-heptose 1,7-bisphosphate phosphatase
MRAIFIDRDGVINKDPGGWTEHSYVTDWKDFKFLPGARQALKILKQKGIKVIVVSNQAGVNKGYYSKEKLDEINNKMLRTIEKAGGAIEEVFYCVHTDKENCDCRKPKSGMLEEAVKKYNIDPKKAYFIGDSKMDIMAGKRIGCKTMLVLSGKTPREDIYNWDEKPDHVFEDLLEAVKWIKGDI